MDWSEEALWNKAKRFHELAREHDREKPRYCFYALLSFEFLSRAALAKVHPALLADPQDPNNILYACGINATERPFSVPAKTVFHRLGFIIQISARTTSQSVAFLPSCGIENCTPVPSPWKR